MFDELNKLEEIRRFRYHSLTKRNYCYIL